MRSAPNIRTAEPFLLICRAARVFDALPTRGGLELLYSLETFSFPRTHTAKTKNLIRFVAQRPVLHVPHA